MMISIWKISPYRHRKRINYILSIVANHRCTIISFYKTPASFAIGMDDAIAFLLLFLPPFVSFDTIALAFAIGADDAIAFSALPQLLFVLFESASFCCSLFLPISLPFCVLLSSKTDERENQAEISN